MVLGVKKGGCFKTVALKWGDIQDIFLFGCPKTIDITGFFKKFCIATRTTPTVTHAPSVYSIGDTAESDGVKVTLVNAETGHGSQYLTPSAGNIFVTLEFEIENDSSSDINVSSIASFEAYCDDYSVTESITAVTLSDKSTLDGNVAAGKKMNGVISYEVPEDWQNLEVTFSPSFWSNHSVTFEVKSN